MDYFFEQLFFLKNGHWVVVFHHVLKQLFHQVKLNHEKFMPERETDRLVDKMTGWIINLIISYFIVGYFIVGFLIMKSLEVEEPAIIIVILS